MKNAPKRIGAWSFSLIDRPDGERVWSGGHWGPAINGRQPTMEGTTFYVLEAEYLAQEARIKELEAALGRKGNHD